MTIERYTFEDRDGTEDSYTTTVAAEAHEFARRYGLRMIANVYEWADSELVADYTSPTAPDTQPRHDVPEQEGTGL